MGVKGGVHENTSFQFPKAASKDWCGRANIWATTDCHQSILAHGVAGYEEKAIRGGWLLDGGG